MILDENLHPLAEYIEIPSGVTLLSGKNCHDHLNRVSSIDISSKFMKREESILCDLNGRIVGHILHADLGDQILLIHNPENAKEIRDVLSTGIPWNEDVQVSTGDGAVHRLIIVGKNPGRVIIGLGIVANELEKGHWTEFFDSMISLSSQTDEYTAFEMLVPTRLLQSIKEGLETNGGSQGDADSWLALQSLTGNIDISVESTNQIPFELGFANLIDLKKGCYPGQEIHARMESRGIQARVGRCLKSEEKIPQGKSRFSEGKRIEILCSHRLGDTWLSYCLISTKLDVNGEISIEASDSTITATFV